jgi:hypothetical protein
MKVMDGTNRRSRGAEKAAVAHQRLQRHRGQGTRATMHRTMRSVSTRES